MSDSVHVFGTRVKIVPEWIFGYISDYICSIDKFQPILES